MKQIGSQFDMFYKLFSYISSNCTLYIDIVNIWHLCTIVSIGIQMSLYIRYWMKNCFMCHNFNDTGVYCFWFSPTPTWHPPPLSWHVAVFQWYIVSGSAQCCMSVWISPVLCVPLVLHMTGTWYNNLNIHLSLPFYLGDGGVYCS